MNKVLYVTTDAESQIRADSAFEGKSVYFLDLSECGTEPAIPANWRRLDDEGYFDGDQFRQDFLGFLEEWPRKPIWKGKCFDDIFRMPSGYSLWWINIGVARTPNKSPFREMRILWIFDKALRQLRPDAVVIVGRDSALLQAMMSHELAKPEISIEHPIVATEQRAGSIYWVGKNIACLLAQPLKLMMVAGFVRIFGGAPRESRANRRQPAILFRSKISRNVQTDGATPTLPFFSELCAELKRQVPEFRQKFLLNRDGTAGNWELIRWLRSSGGRLLRAFPGAIPLNESYPGLRAWLRAFPSQVISLFRFYRLAKLPDLHKSLTFAGANVASIFLPRIDDAVSSMAEWERKVGAIASSIRSQGNVKLLFVIAEFYRGSMQAIAAAHSLGIPTVGVQHGTIFPMHFVYTIPRGHVTRAPIPDYFAAYGDYAKEIVSVLGTYPAERVWVTGASRLDRLVNSPHDQRSARQRLNLPIDKKVVLIPTQTYRWFPEAVQAVFEATSQRDDCVVCLKPHFGDRKRVGLYQQMAQQLGIDSLRIFEAKFDDLLAACDVLISSSSTTILEACLLGRPTICANFSSEPDRYPYATEGASIAARSREDMHVALERLLSQTFHVENETRRLAFLQRHAGPTLDGRGTKTLVQHVSRLLKNEHVTQRTPNATPESRKSSRLIAAHDHSSS